MEVEIFSHILATGGIAIFALILIHILGYSFSAKIRELTTKISYFKIISLIGILATIATVGALIYQFVYELTVCELCWWQRIFMFPIEFIVLFTIIFKIKNNHFAIASLASVGLIFSLYHYSVHFQKWILKSDNLLLATQCVANAWESSCASTTGVMAYGFFTIPLMAGSIFALIIWLCFLAHKNLKNSGK